MPSPRARIGLFLPVPTAYFIRMANVPADAA